MNKIYTITYDGRVYVADSLSTSFELFNTDDENSIKFKRLSSSDYCIWGISSEFELFLFVYNADIPIEFTEITYENQRRYNLFSADSFCGNLMKTDRPNFSSKDGTLELKKEHFNLPTKNWSWETDWETSEAWEYAIDFPAKFHPKFFHTACVRRRVWTRTRRFFNTNKFIQIENVNLNECFIDVQIGGWSIPYVCNKGFLSVWAVTNGGKIYFRQDVSYQCVEGSKWLEIDSQSSGVVSCACSKTGSLVVITFDGDIKLRLNISRDNPTGSSWVIVSQPTLVSNIRQIVIGTYAFWALDNQGGLFFRAGVRTELPQGTKWVNIPANLSSISLSSSDQLWGIDSKDKRLNLRSGINENENPSGTYWRLVNLKCKQKTLRSADNESINSLRTDQIKQTQSLQQDSISQNDFISNEDPNKVDEIDDDIYNSDDDIYSPQYYSSPILTETTTNESSKQETESLSFKASAKNVHPNIYTTDHKFADEEIDRFIEKFKPKSIETCKDSDVLPKDSTSFGNISFNTIDSAELSKYDEHEDSTRASYNDTTSTTSDILIEIDFKECIANSFTTESSRLPNHWFQTSADTTVDFLLLKNMNENWKEEISNDLKKRNIKEHVNIDKISKFYENISDSWTRSESFIFVHRNKKINCLLEIDTKHKSLPSATSFEAVLMIKLKKKNNNYETLKMIDFKQIRLATRWSILSNQMSTYPCFALFIQNEDKPLVFMSETENKLKDWLNQISIYCSKLSNIQHGHGGISLKNAITIINTDGNAYFAFIDSNQVKLIKQIDGHLKCIEKHSSGTTYAIGNNGRLWHLSIKNNATLDNYFGPFFQTDEVEVHTYENQRWNVISGLINIKNGFTDIGFPTDRYLWSDESGKYLRRKQDCILPSSLFTWSTDWKIDFSTQGGVDSDGWQYAFDFPNEYHGVRCATDFVRRRRWFRKCRFKTPSFWKEINQTHHLKCIALDQEENNVNKILLENTVLMWAIDHDGFIMSALVDISNPTLIKWQHVASAQNFQAISIGLHLKIWGLDVNGSVWIRYSVSKENNFRGTSWSLISNEEDLKFKSISAGNFSVWAITDKNELYFRENITKDFPEGTNWLKIDSSVLSVSVNHKNQVVAIKITDLRHYLNEGVLFNRTGITKENLKGNGWSPLIKLKMKLNYVSNRGMYFNYFKFFIG